MHVYYAVHPRTFPPIVLKLHHKNILKLCLENKSIMHNVPEQSLPLKKVL